jgi:hypothetical protein
VLYNSQMKRLALSHYATAHSVAQLQRCLPLLGTNQPLPAGALTRWELFPLEAGWFLDWCNAMQLKPVFPPVGTQLIPAAKVKKSKNKLHEANRDEFACFRHLVVNLVPDTECDSYGHSAGTGSLRRLANTQLLQRNEEGVHQLLSPPAAVPYNPHTPTSGPALTATTRENGPAVLQYVLLPYQLGRHLYERYDSQAGTLPAALYRR